MKIAAYAIAKNEERNIENFLNTVQGFDEVIVVDTGSSDKTVNILREAGIKVIERIFDPFDFSEARNHSLSLVSESIDWCFSVDFNDRLDEDWRKKFGRIIKAYPQATAVEIKRYDDCGGTVTRGSEDKLILHKRELYQWKNAVHEMIEIRKDFVEQRVESDIAITKKIQRSAAKEDFYATICLREYRKDTTQSFYLWFLVGYYYDRSDWKNAIEYGLHYLETTSSVKSDFRVHTYLRLNRAFYERGEREQSFRYGMLGFSEAMFFPEQAVFRQAVDHMIHCALVMDNAELLVFLLSFVKVLSPELEEVKRRALERLR